jgi:hypothetical protein
MKQHSRKSKLASALARAALAERAALAAEIKLALSRQRIESLQREITQKLCADISTTVDAIVPSHDLPGKIDLAAQLVADPDLIPLSRLSAKPPRIRR